MCPACGSLVRHRLIAAAIRYHPIAARLPLDGRVLHISPEYCVSLLLRDRASHYVRGDWAANDCDVKQDITALPFADGCFDVIVACDTLEHVLDDRAALRECARVLRRNGIAILTVPQADTEYRTDEDESVTAPAEREARFGQSDHVRNYGADFIDRIEAAGLRATCIDASAFDPAVVERHVLGPPMPLSTPRGWNRRRVYFGEAE
jgi:SAM-dependent methyltransferase